MHRIFLRNLLFTLFTFYLSVDTNHILEGVTIKGQISLCVFHSYCKFITSTISQTRRKYIAYLTTSANHSQSFSISVLEAQ